MDTTDRTHRLGLPYLANDQAQKHVTVNEGLRALDALVHTSVLSAAADAQPAAPAPGDAYLLTPARTGEAWASMPQDALAAFQDGAWAAFSPKVGMTAWVADEGRHRVWDGAAWVRTVREETSGPAAPQEAAPRFGVNAEADDVSRLAVKSDAVLHTHDDASGQGTGDARHVINKAGPDRTASLVFQTSYSGRAELGLTGGDDLAFKVSSDGAAFREALRVDRATGAVALPHTPACPATGAPAPAAFSLLSGGLPDHLPVTNDWTRMDGGVLDTVEVDNGAVADGRFTVDEESAGVWLLGGCATFYAMDDASKAVVGVRIDDEAARFRLLGRGTSAVEDLAGFGGSVLVRLAPGETASLWFAVNDPADPRLARQAGYNAFYGVRVSA